MGKHVTRRTNKPHGQPPEKKKRGSEKGQLGVNSLSVPEAIKIATSCVLILLISFFKLDGVVELAAYLIPYFIVSYDLYLSVISRINRGNLLNDALIFLATSVLTIFVGNYFESVVILVLYRLTGVGMSFLRKILHEKRVTHDGNSGESCLVVTDNGLERLGADQIGEGERLLLRKGDRLLVDAILLDTSCSMDVSFLTGDRSSRVFQTGDFIPSGSVSLNSANVTVQACSDYDQSCYFLLKDRMDRSNMFKSSFERTVANVMHYLDMLRVPLALVLIVAGGLITGQWSEWIRRGTILLIVTESRLIRSLVAFCFDTCIIRAADSGIYLKSNDAAEKLQHIQTAVFEKAGVITDNEYELRDCKPEKISEREMIAYIAKMLSKFSSPLKSVFWESADQVLLKSYTIENQREYPGKGYSALINGNRVYLGNAPFISGFSDYSFNQPVPDMALHLVISGEYKGYVTVSDKLKEGVFDAFEKLRANGASNLVMLTEASSVSARKLALSLNIDMIRAEITPDEKRNSLEYLIKNKNKGASVAFVGSCFSDTGLYDAADVSMVLQPINNLPPVRGEADAVIFSNSLSKVSEAVDICAWSGHRLKNLFYAGIGLPLLLMSVGIIGLLKLLPCLILLMLIYAVEFALAIRNT